MVLAQGGGAAVWGKTSIEVFGQDARFAGRLLRKNPGFTAVVVLTLALGIGATTSIFTVVNALVIKPLPYQDPEGLVVPATIFQRLHTDRGSVSYPDILDWKSQQDIFEAVSAVTDSDFDITGADEPERVRGLIADADYFRVMKSQPVLGRVFTRQDDVPKANLVVVLSYGFWMRRFGGDSKALGSRIELGGVPHIVIGVMPKDSTFPQEAEIFKPLGFGSTPLDWTMRRDNHVFNAIARLKPGVAIDQAQAKLTVMGSRIAREETNRAGTNWKLHPLRDFVLGPTLGRTLWILLGAVLLVLLIACVNVANLLLARSAARQWEFAIRKALGAASRRLARQFLVESAVLAFAGGAAGMLLAYWSVKALIHFAPAGVPRLEIVRIDLVVLGFAVALCLLTALVFGIAPVLHGSRTAPIESLREGGRGSSGGVHTTYVRGVLVVSELALAVILLAGAGLLIRSFALLQRVNPGFPTKNLLTMQVSLPNSRYAEGRRVAVGFEEIVGAGRRLPGVLSASATSSLPLGGGGSYLGRVFLTEGQAEPPATHDTAAQWSVIQPGYFRTMGFPIVAGRDFTDRDTKDSSPVIIISQSMAQQMFPDQNPLGRRIRSWRDENVYREIVGVAGDVHYWGLDEDIPNNVYVPHAQDSWRTLVLTIRTQGDPHGLVQPLRTAIWARDNKLTIAEVQSMDEIVATALARPRFLMFLLGVFAVTALVMAAVGIYGLMSFAVTQRNREIGIRMALGALRWDILRIVTGRALLLALGGVVVGIGSAMALTRLMASLLFGVSPTDVSTFVAASAVLILVAIFASYIPARRASKVDPLIALRYE